MSTEKPRCIALTRVVFVHRCMIFAVDSFETLWPLMCVHPAWADAVDNYGEAMWEFLFNRLPEGSLSNFWRVGRPRPWTRWFLTRLKERKGFDINAPCSGGY